MLVFNDETTKGKNMNFSEMTRDELRKLAAEADIRGRSKMTKAELAEALEYTYIGEPEPQDTNVNALVTRDAPGMAYVNLNTAKDNVAVITRKGRRWELQTSTGETMTIRARSIAKAVKAWAKRLGIMLNGIETVKQF